MVITGKIKQSKVTNFVLCINIIILKWGLIWGFLEKTILEQTREKHYGCINCCFEYLLSNLIRSYFQTKNCSTVLYDIVWKVTGVMDQGPWPPHSWCVFLPDIYSHLMWICSWTWVRLKWDSHGKSSEMWV